MAQIKKIVKPGDLIRGAKVGVAGLDKDGNVISVPGNVTPPYAAADVGKILTAGSSGPTWSPVPGVTPLYRHSLAIYKKNTSAYKSAGVGFTIINSSPTSFTNANTIEAFHTYLTENGISLLSPASGSIFDSSNGKKFIISWVDVTTTALVPRGYFVESSDNYVESIYIQISAFDLYTIVDNVVQIV